MSEDTEQSHSAGIHWVTYEQVYAQRKLEGKFIWRCNYPMYRSFLNSLNPKMGNSSAKDQKMQEK